MEWAFQEFLDKFMQLAAENPFVDFLGDQFMDVVQPLVSFLRFEDPLFQLPGFGGFLCLEVTEVFNQVDEQLLTVLVGDDMVNLLANFL